MSAKMVSISAKCYLPSKNEDMALHQTILGIENTEIKS